MNVWKLWTESKGLNDDIVDYEAKELDKCLSRLLAEIWKSNDLKILSLNYVFHVVFSRWFELVLTKKLPILFFSLTYKDSY